LELLDDRIALPINAPAGLIAINAPRAIHFPVESEQLLLSLLSAILASA
jgi:hypothetical protein